MRPKKNEFFKKLSGKIGSLVNVLTWYDSTEEENLNCATLIDVKWQVPPEDKNMVTKTWSFDLGHPKFVAIKIIHNEKVLWTFVDQGLIKFL